MNKRILVEITKSVSYCLIVLGLIIAVCGVIIPYGMTIVREIVSCAGLGLLISGFLVLFAGGLCEACLPGPSESDGLDDYGL